MIGEPNPDQKAAYVLNYTKQNQNQQSTNESGNLPPQSKKIPIEIRTSQIPLDIEDNFSVKNSIQSSIKSINSQIGFDGLNMMGEIEIQHRLMYYLLSISDQDSEKASQTSMEIDDDALFRIQTLSSARGIKNQKQIHRGNQLNARILHQKILPKNALNKGKQSSFDYEQQSECSQQSLLESNRSKELNSFSKHFPLTSLSDGPSFMASESSSESSSSNACIQSKLKSCWESSSSSDQSCSKIQVPKRERAEKMMLLSSKFREKDHTRSILSKLRPASPNYKFPFTISSEQSSSSDQDCFSMQVPNRLPTNMMMLFNSKFRENNHTRSIQSKSRLPSPNYKFRLMVGSRKRYFKRRSSLEKRGFNIWEKIGET